MSITSKRSAGTGILAVIFFSPRNEKRYDGGPGRLSSLAGQCGRCVLEQVKHQQQPKGEGSMYTLDLAMLADCMSKKVSGLRGLLVAAAASSNFLAGRTECCEGPQNAFEFKSRPATSFPVGHVFAYNDFQPLKLSKNFIYWRQIPTLFFAILLAPPR